VLLKLVAEVLDCDAGDGLCGESGAVPLGEVNCFSLGGLEP
jgi:hypothetical protein